MQSAYWSEASGEGHFRAKNRGCFKKENCGVEHGEQPRQRLQTVCWIHTHTQSDCRYESHFSAIVRAQDQAGEMEGWRAGRFGDNLYRLVRPVGLQMNEAETTAVQGCSGRVLFKDGEVREYLGATGNDLE